MTTALVLRSVALVVVAGPGPNGSPRCQHVKTCFPFCAELDLDMASERTNRISARVFRLGEEPRDDLSEGTTAQERLDILRDLTERAWQLSGREFPTYSRHEIPVLVTSVE